MFPLCVSQLAAPRYRTEPQAIMVGPVLINHCGCECLKNLTLTKIHHAAFDAHLIGIDPDLRIHVSDRLLEMTALSSNSGLKGSSGR
jgi:hypothetical protein